MQDTALSIDKIYVATCVMCKGLLDGNDKVRTSEDRNDEVRHPVLWTGHGIRGIDLFPLVMPATIS